MAAANSASVDSASLEGGSTSEVPEPSEPTVPLEQAGQQPETQEVSEISELPEEPDGADDADDSDATEGPDEVIIVNTDDLQPDTMVSCSGSVDFLRQRMLELTNAARAEARYCGTDFFNATTPVTWNDTLAIAAKTHSDDMATHNFFSHTGSDGSSIGTRATSANYNWRTVGENIAAGQSTVTQAVQGWIDSPGHCRNLMNPGFTEIALACTEDSGADYTRYWTNVLGAQR